jgi:hypothetical protein
MSTLPSLSSLLSPPMSTSLDRFDTILTTPPRAAYRTLPPMQTPEKMLRILPSPPVSPWAAHEDKMAKEGAPAGIYRDAGSMRDPVLYPDRRRPSGPTPTERPLFPADGGSAMVEELVDRHMARHHVQFRNMRNPPTRDEYMLAAYCVSTLGTRYNKNPGAYLKRVRDETEEHYFKARRICAKPAAAPANVRIAPAPARPPRRPLAPAKDAFRRQRRTPKQSPTARLLDSPDPGRLATPERSQAQKRPEDTDYHALPDFAPPLASLPPGNSRCLKTDWASTNPLDLTNDPDRHMLHEAEVNLASTLRLTCATYLCSKRRIFEARLRAYRIGKEFRKTDAQQACKIDVNKASKLWTAYDRVGWFRKEHLANFL